MTRRHRRAHVVIWGLLVAGVIIGGVLASRNTPTAEPVSAEGSP